MMLIYSGSERRQQKRLNKISQYWQGEKKFTIRMKTLQLLRQNKYSIKVQQDMNNIMVLSHVQPMNNMDCLIIMGFI